MVTSGMPRVGVLALQGDVREHVRSLEALGAESDVPVTVVGEVVPGDGVVFLQNSETVGDLSGWDHFRKA